MKLRPHLQVIHSSSLRVFMIVSTVIITLDMCQFILFHQEYVANIWMLAAMTKLYGRRCQTCSPQCCSIALAALIHFSKQQNNATVISSMHSLLRT
jgi:hypothetical protein